MNLKCRINGVEYEALVQGTTFSDEYNETLDSGSVILDHIEEIKDLKPYDDVYIYEGEFDRKDSERRYYNNLIVEKNYFKGYNLFSNTFFIKNEDNSGAIDSIYQSLHGGIENQNLKFISSITFKKNGLEVANIDIIYSNCRFEIIENTKMILISEESPIINGDTEHFLFDIPGFSNNGINLDFILNENHTEMYWDSEGNKPGVFTEFDDFCYQIYDTLILDENENFGNDFKLLTQEQKQSTKKEFRENITIGIDNNFGLENGKIINGIRISDNFTFSVTITKNKENNESEKIKKVYTCFITKDNNNDISFKSEKCSSFILKGETLDIGNHYFVDDGIFLEVEKEEVEKDKYKYIFFKRTNTYENIEDYFTYSFEFENIPFAINEQENTNITINEQENTNKSFYKHFLLDTYFKERINNSPYLDNGKILYKYKLQLFSEAKRLETIQLPNISITQPVKFGNKKTKTVYHYIKQFVNMYSPKIKVDVGDGKWLYLNKYYLDPKLKEIFGNVYSPSFSLNNPNLRDVLKNLMLVKDQIPIVIDDMISCLDVTKRNGVFEEKGILSVVYSLNSENYCDSLKRTYNNALSQENTCKSIEFLNFRNSDQALMTIDNMRLETRFPIYKINKMYMYYFKESIIKTFDDNNTPDKTQIYLCEQDITPLVKLNSERQLLKKDWNELENEFIPFSIEDLSKYRMATIGYDIGSKYINGWGEIYNYIKKDISWFKYDKTYIQNILVLTDNLNPYGTKKYYMISDEKNKEVFVPGKLGFESYNKGGTNEEPHKVIYDIFGSEIAKNDLISPFTNNVLSLKGLFFKIEYEGFYNGTIVHSKNNGYSDITTNDNSSASLTLLEKDGLFQKEKINRFSNEQVTIQARYTDINDVQPLGSVYSDDIIIYHREISVFDNIVLATYYGTKDYVLKNYFTTVFAKHRPYNLLPYEESVVRAENKKVFLNFSKEKILYEKNKIFNFNLKNVLNFFKSNMNEEASLSNEIFENKEEVNSGYMKINGEKYASDVNTFVSGNSLCLNMAMYDNVSGGVYIKEKEPDVKLIVDNVEKDFTGSVQDWYITVDDVETGYLKNIGFYFSHKKDYFKIQVFDVDYVKDKFYKQIFELPKITFENNNEIILMDGEFELNKDNKELIDMTFQIEPISTTNDVFFSQWMMKLSNLLGVYNKNDVEIKVKDHVVADFKIERIVSNIKYGGISLGLVNSYFPLIILKVKKEDIDKIKNGSVLNQQYVFEYLLDSSFIENYVSFYSVYLNELISLSEEKDIFYVTANENIEYYDYNARETKETINNKNIFFKKTKEICGLNLEQIFGGEYFYYTNMDFYKYSPFDRSEIAKVKEEYEKNLIKVNGVETKICCGIKENKWLNADDLFINGVESLTKDALDTGSFKIVEYNLGDSVTGIYPKNMFIILSDKPMKEHLVYDEYEDISEVSGYKLTNYKVGDIISLNNDFGPHIKINLNDISSEEDYKSVQMWYYVDGSYKFVFGVNVTEKDKDSGEIKIYVSTISNKDPRVFNSNGLLVGEVVNYLDETNDKEYGTEQFFKKK